MDQYDSLKKDKIKLECYRLLYKYYEFDKKDRAYKFCGIDKSMKNSSLNNLSDDLPPCDCVESVLECDIEIEDFDKNATEHGFLSEDIKYATFRVKMGNKEVVLADQNGRVKPDVYFYGIIYSFDNEEIIVKGMLLDRVVSDPFDYSERFNDEFKKAMNIKSAS
ncbi:hypothetical protein [Saprospira grandis]|uniref:hypothetical protein n=1 Tax=Saprospira grandis TaxID=1008 RepID=UPI0011D1CA35|nr:hypothetical protein [Saprospira grandis]